MIRTYISTLVHERQTGRKARIARNQDGAPLGVALFVTPEELEDFGVNPSTANSVVLRVSNGVVRISSSAD